MPEFKSQQKKRKPLPIAADHKPDEASSNPEELSVSEQLAAVAEISQERPSVYATRVAAILQSKRVQLNFSNTPKLIVDEFDRLAKERNMKKIEYFYYLLRQDGADIPKYDDLDARRRIANFKL